jgi:hypothetical protein
MAVFQVEANRVGMVMALIEHCPDVADEAWLRGVEQDQLVHWMLTNQMMIARLFDRCARATRPNKADATLSAMTKWKLDIVRIRKERFRRAADFILRKKPIKPGRVLSKTGDAIHRIAA